MNNQDFELTLLTEEEVYGDSKVLPLDVFRKHGIVSAVTDLLIITGGTYSENGECFVFGDDSLRGRSGSFVTKSSFDRRVLDVNSFAFKGKCFPCERNLNIRPVLQFKSNKKIENNNVSEINMGWYPQYAPSFDIQKILEIQYLCDFLKTTGNCYYVGLEKCNEYVYDEKKYIRVKVNLSLGTTCRKNEILLSNGIKYQNGDYVWLEASPVGWLVDYKTQKLISKRCLLSGIRFKNDLSYDGNFNDTEMYNYLNNYMIYDLFQSNNYMEDNNKIYTKKR